MTSNNTASVICTAADLTSKWLSEVLQKDVTSFESARIGTGQVSECYRVTLQYTVEDETPKSVILKIASSDPTSRGSGRSLGIYEREVLFYKTIAPRIGGKDSPLAHCYHAEFQDDFFSILLSDAAPAVVGNDIEGLNMEQARAAVSALAKLHAPTMQPDFLEKNTWLHRAFRIDQGALQQMFAGYMDRYKGYLDEAHVGVMGRFVSCFDAYIVQTTQPGLGRVFGLVHGDYRGDNLLLSKESNDVTVVDWQTVSYGSPLADLAYLLGSSVPVSVRRAHGEDLLSLYHKGLGSDSPLTLDQVREGVREQAFLGVTMGICSPMLVERTERGDAMFMTMMQRNCSMILDLNCVDLLPDPSMAEPLKPKKEDEHLHPHSEDLLWNESWYFDLVDESQNAAAYVRLGVTPNQKGSWYTAMITLPDNSCVAVTDYAAPHPAEDLVVKTDSFHATHVAQNPLETYRLTLDGKGSLYSDPSAILRDEKPDSTVDVSMELAFETDGQPYMWRLTPRYEIPCRVTGTIKVGDTSLRFDNTLGQRDHSWSPRDWWGADWMWCAFHFEDGQRIHGADLRIQGRPSIGVGYIQGPERSLSELVLCASDENMGANGLPVSAWVNLKSSTEDNLTVSVSPRGHAPLRLVSEEGKVARFTRAWVDLHANDGRKGVGWIEFNHNEAKQ